MPTTARNMSPLTMFCSGYVIGRPVRSSCSLPKAMRLPVSVTKPMSTPSMIVSLTWPSTLMSASVMRTNSDTAMTAEAPPPTPLKIATICGIAVILMVRASTAPMTAPMAMPAAIIS